MLRTGTLVFALTILATQSALASTISYVGLDTTTGSAWRSTGTAKSSAYDLNGDGVYGGDGYYVAYSTLSGTNGVGTVDANVMSKMPTYLSCSFIGGSYGGNVFFNSAQARVDDPSLTPGTSVADLICGAVFQGKGDGSSTKMFSITMTSDTTFQLGLILGTHDQLTHEASSVTITGSDGTTLTEAVSTINKNSAEYMFFTITATAGETFTISVTGNGAQASCAGLMFESVPEPSSTAMTIVGAAGLLAFAWRKRRK
jgi:hypothetical protein